MNPLPLFIHNRLSSTYFDSKSLYESVHPIVSKNPWKHIFSDSFLQDEPSSNRLNCLIGHILFYSQTNPNAISKLVKKIQSDLEKVDPYDREPHTLCKNRRICLRTYLICDFIGRKTIDSKENKRLLNWINTLESADNILFSTQFLDLSDHPLSHIFQFVLKEKQITQEVVFNRESGFQSKMKFRLNDQVFLLSQRLSVLSLSTWIRSTNPTGLSIERENRW